MQNKVQPSLVDYLSEAGLHLQPGTNKLALPDWCHRIKFDVGLSHNAPMTAEWLRREPKHLLVFCFEPVARNFERASDALRTQILELGHESKVVLLPFALGTFIGSVEMYVTEDGGQSSLLKPTRTATVSKETVMMERLDSLLRLIDWGRFPMIDFLKTDCQGTDLEVISGAGHYLERFAVICAEAGTVGYSKSRNSARRMRKHLEAFDFELINPRPWHRSVLGGILSRISPLQKIYENHFRSLEAPNVSSSSSQIETQDPTFVNARFKEKVQAGKLKAFQWG